MRGTFYAATEIVVFLLIATLIGIVIGRLWAAAIRRPDQPDPAVPAKEPADSATQAELRKIGDQLAAAEAAKADLAKQLSVVEWQVETLEEELAKNPPAGADAE